MIIIIGAGLSGLLTGCLLQNEGIPFKILEARDRIGGRINTLYKDESAPVEMGATWFTHQHRHLISLLGELGIEAFEQYMDKTVFYQQSAASPTQQVQIPPQAPSYRVSGGSTNLINRLYEQLDPSNVFLNQEVKAIKIDKDKVQVVAKETFEGGWVVLALPPKLWATNITFDPELPSDLMDLALETHTWMEDSIKVALTYDQPFWQKKNLPSTLFSNVGPITEFYDHSNHAQSKYALCGFINASLKHLSDADRRQLVLNQVTQIFGPEAAGFITYESCVWSEEKHTFVASEDYISPHQNNGHPLFRQGVFEDRLFISSSESAAEFPGYMEGAVHSAKAVVAKIVNNSALV